MSESGKPAVIIVSLQVQTSFQAVPLGAACVVSALRSDEALSSRASIRLADWSLEESEFTGKTPAESGSIIARRIRELCGSPTVRALVGFSMYVWNRPVMTEAALALRAMVPGVALFAGGPEATASPGQIEPFDCLVRGEGESASREIVRLFLDGKPYPPALREGGRSPAESCAMLPSPWLDGTLDDCRSVRECKGALWELSRGCPYSCSYCYESKGEKKVRAIPLDRLERELDHFAGIGIERVFVLDPTYNASRERALSLLAMIERKAPGIHFNFEARAELLDAEMAKAFSNIPCSVQIGLQSSNPAALALINRPVDLKLFKRKIALLNDAGVVFGLDLMYGLPGDTLADFRSSVDFALALYPNNLEIFRLAVLPGTVLADRADGLGLRRQKSPPYHVESTPGFPEGDVAKATRLAEACDIFYTQGRAVSWFLSALHPLKLRGSQFLGDFAAFISTPDARARYGLPPCVEQSPDIPHRAIERLQLEFLGAKYAEKGKAYLMPALRDVVRLNGAWTRALAEGEETKLELSYSPEDIFSPDSMDLEGFTENACMEQCRVRVFSGSEGPDLEIE